MKKWTILLVYFVFNIFTPTFSQTLQFKNITVTDGLLSSTVYCVYQDSKGFIWFATINGVSRYDGKTFENFTTDNGLSDNEVLKIVEDSRGRIWFLTFNGKLSYYLDGVIYNQSNNNLLKKLVAKSSFVNLYEDSKQIIRISTIDNEMFTINQNKINYKVIVKDNSKYLLNGIHFLENDEGDVFGINHNTFYQIKNNTFFIKKLTYYPIDDVRSIHFEHKTKTLYFISDVGIISMKNGKQTVLKKLPKNLINKGISNLKIYNSKIWVSFLGDGIKVYDLEKNTEESYLPKKFISSMIRDKEQNIWISTIGDGVYFLSRKANDFIHYTLNNPLTNEAVYSVIKDNQNRIWLGLRNGEFNILGQNKSKVLNPKFVELTYNPIKKLFYNTVLNTVWFISDRQIGQLNDVELPLSTSNLAGSKISISLKSFDFNEIGEIAIATSSGLFKYQSKVEKPDFYLANSNEFEQLEAGRTFNLAYDENNYLWFAQLNSLKVLDSRNRLYQFSKKLNVLNDRINHLFSDKKGIVYAATSSKGVAIFKDYKLVKVITTKDGLNSNNCFKTFAKDNYLWVITNKGVTQIENPLGQIKATYYTIDNGLLTNEVNDILVDNGIIYLATNKGLTKINKSQNRNYFPELPLYFKSIIVKDKIIKNTNKLIELPHGDNSIRINYTAINFEEPNNIIYAYKTKENDAWIPTPNNFLEFVSLEPGNYALQIRARDLNGNWGSSIKLSIVVSTPFYENPFFIFLAILVLIGLFILSYNKYLQVKRKKDDQVLLNKSKIIALEQQALQAMMNPHFIFNVMNSIQYFINTQDKGKANQLLTGFARLIRKNMEIVNKSEITLAEEISYLNLYLQLENLRFGDKLNYKLTVDDDLDTEEIFIPSMIIQPYIENAIWHGIMPKDDLGHIEINITQERNLLKIIVKDDGVGIDNSIKLKNDGYISRGMSITKERINLINQLSGNEMNIKINQREEGGTIVQIIIPIQD
jgi:ligand-binding sensor domain-containing protein